MGVTFQIGKICASVTAPNGFPPSLERLGRVDQCSNSIPRVFITYLANIFDSDCDLFQVLPRHSIPSQVSSDIKEGRLELRPTRRNQGFGQITLALPEPGTHLRLVQRLGAETENDNPVCELSQEKQRGFLQMIVGITLRLY